MKRMLKKMSAIALAGAMALSLSVSALAADGDPVEKTDIAAAKGQATGEGTTMGGIPEDAINIKLPTNAAAHAFDVKFDPHNLIRLSNNATKLGGEDATFADDTLIYFKNTSEDGVSFSKTSDPIKVINKSNVPVSVEMTAKWDKKTGTYALVKDADALAAAKAKGEAALYLYLTEDISNTTSPVLEKDKSVPYVTWESEKDTANSDATTDVAQKYLKDYIKSVTFAFTDAADEQDIKLINEGKSGQAPSDWVFTLTKVDKKTPTVALDASKLPNYTTVSGTTVKTDNAYKTANAANISITATPQAEGTVYTVPGDKAESAVKIQKGNTDIATITFEWDYEAIAKNSYNINEEQASATETGKKTTYKLTITGHSGEGAKLDVPVNTTPDSYQLVETSNGSGVLKWDFADGFSNAADDDDKFQSVSFRLTGAITDGDVCADAWDTAFGSTVTGTQLDLVWKASKCDALDPTAKVTSALTAATGTATLDVDWGYGDKKTTTITAASYDVNGTATELPMANVVVNDNTVTITSVAGLFNPTGANGKLTLTFKHADTGYEKEVTVDLKTAAT